MKKLKTNLLYLAFCLSLVSCSRDNDHSAALRSDQLKALWGDDGDGMLASQGFFGPNEDFLPLQESDLHGSLADGAIPLPVNEPGAPGSGVPGLDQFRGAMAGLAKIFQNVYFDTDDYVLRKSEFMAVIERASEYLKEHPHTYVAVEGHCDERASEAYNLALGTRRSNYVRSLLIKRGVNPEQVHPVSYGKERPLEKGHNPDAWSKNRRVEFKIFERS